MKTLPLNNNVLVEIIREDDLVSRSGENESLKEGRVVNHSISPWHLTASSAMSFAPDETKSIDYFLGELHGKIVRWEEYAEGGQTFEEDGKTYALIPWWRLIGFKEAE